MADDPQLGDGNAPDLGGLVNAVGVLLQDGWNVGGTMGWAIDNAVKWSVGLIGVVMRGATRILTVVAAGIQKILEEDNPELGKLAATILGGMFGNDFATNIPGGIFHPGNLDDNAQAVGAAVLASVFGPLQLDGGGDVEPGVERAEGYLGAIANMVTRGFVLDLVEEIVPHWHFEAIHNLEHELISGLGLGRIARTVLRPVVTTLVADPAQWQINLAYRPHLMPDAVALRELAIAGDRADLAREHLGRAGYSDDVIDLMVNAHRKQLAPDELFALVEDGTITEADALGMLRASGYDDEAASLAWEAARGKRAKALTTHAADVWLHKYETGLITKDQFVRSLATLKLPDDVAALYVLVGGAVRETPSQELSVAELRQAWTKNLITQGEFHDRMVAKGYSEDDATTLVLLQLVELRDKQEADDARKQAQADRAAKVAADKAAADAKREADKQAAEQQRQAKAAAAAAQRAKVAADELALKQFAIDAAAAKTALVESKKAAGAVAADAAQLAQEQIAADLQELLATITAQTAASKATFDRQILELRQADREATVQQQLDDVDLALTEDQALRTAAVTARLQAVADVETRKLADLDDLATARGQAITDDLTAATAAIDAATLPSAAERQAHAAAAIADLDTTLTRKLADIAADYDARRQANDANLENGLVKQTPHDLEATRLQLAEDQAARLAQQQHDLSVTRFQEVARHTDTLALDTANTQKAALVTAADKARSTLSADMLKQAIAVKQAADTERLALQQVAAQIAPITQAEAARRRRAIQVAADQAKRSEQITETEIAKGEADAQAALQKANATVAAARQRVAQAQAAAGSRESAQTGATAALAGLQASLDAKRIALETQLAHDQAGIQTGM